MRFGIKIYSKNHDLFLPAIRAIKEGKADYLEIKYFPKDIEHMGVIERSGVPVVLHALETNEGYCFSQGPTSKNRQYFDEIIRVANRLRSRIIIIHPDDGTTQGLASFLAHYHDNRITIENMPLRGIGRQVLLGSTPDEMRRLLGLAQCGFCLDFGHAAKSAISHKEDYKEQIKKYLDLKPVIFHLTDVTFSLETDEHLHLGSGELDVKFIKALLADNDCLISMETPKDKGIISDLENIDYYKRL